MLKQYLSWALKGLAMGAANVIPGVSGGTIALITGIFERLINAIKSFNLIAVKLLIKGQFKAFAQHTDLAFLSGVFAGVGIAIISLARLLDYLFTHYPVYIWAYFFGLILASVFFVGRTVEKWSWQAILAFIIGAFLAIGLSFMNPATENQGTLYLMLCGVAAICSMILPGLSGSFVLILMGNYQLIMIDAVNTLNLQILLPVALGAAGGLIIFSHILAWVFKRFRNQTIALLSGFILGSLGIIWPWKETIYALTATGEHVIKHGKPVIATYHMILPHQFNGEVIMAIVLMITGIISIWLIEKHATDNV